MKLLSAAFIAALFVPCIDAGIRSEVENARRGLLSKLEDDGWAGVLQSCSEVEYETSLFVDNHVFVVSTPVIKHYSDCPSLAMEQGAPFAKPTDTDFGVRSVNVHNFTSTKKEPHLSIGTFPLSQIAAAFHNAQAKALSDPDSMKNYDPVMQNCGDFAALMMTLLEIDDFDHEKVQFIAKQLQKRHPTFIRSVRISPKTVNLLPSNTKVDELTDLQLLELLVEYKVKHLYSPSTTLLSDSYNDPDQGHRVLHANEVSDDAPTADTTNSRRLAEVDCGRWYSSGCLAENDIRYDSTASNAIADQNAAWNKFEGFYEATATAYGPDGRVIEPSFMEQDAATFAPDQRPYSQAPFKMFINITLSGSRLYEQMQAIFPPPPEVFCNQSVPDGMQNVLSPGECGSSGAAGIYERFGTSTFEKDGSVTMLPFGITMSGTELDRKSYVSLPAGESNHFSSYWENGLLVQYASACLDAECSQLSTTIDQYNTSALAGEEYTFLASTRVFATRLASSQQFRDAVDAAFLEYNVPSDQRPFEDGCLSGFCPDESDWCEYDPECAVSPYSEPEASIVAGPVVGVVVAVAVVIFLALFALHRRQMKQKEGVVRKQFTTRIAEGITVNGTRGPLSPDQLLAEFHKIDEDNGGTLEKQELWAFLESGKVGSMSRSDFDLLFSVIDVDRSGSVDFNEFVAFFASAMRSDGSRRSQVMSS
ncbi:unnamed protein product [Cylindrotheca closterium]|uniref:EF-hand domain-containing protein n=1 Tax=Cylindrotheca closterium TaxID=2856 RepID=A0AAD2G7G1_9STRA|nr:unnamed protein product [Cylindrotheca closterium]